MCIRAVMLEDTPRPAPISSHPLLYPHLLHALKQMGRLLVRDELPRGGQKPAEGVFGVDARLDGVAREGDGLLFVCWCGDGGGGRGCSFY